MLKAIRKTVGRWMSFDAEKAKLSRQLEVTTHRLVKAALADLEKLDG